MKSQKITLTALSTLLATTFALSPQFIHLVTGTKHCESKTASSTQNQKPQCFTYKEQVLAQTPEVLEARANQLLQLGIRQHKTAQFQAALESTQQAIALYRDINNLKGQAYALGNLGDIYFSLGQYSQAIDSYQQQVEIAKSIGDRPTLVKALLALSNAYFYIGQEGLAKQLQQQATIVKREIGNPRGEAAFYGDVGIAYTARKDYPQAIDFYQQQLARTQKIGDRFGEAYALSQVGQVYESQGKYKEAIAFYQQQLEVARKAKDAAGEINILTKIAEAYKSQGKYKEAIAVYQQQLDIAKARRNMDAQANALNALAAAYRHEGQYPQAIELYQQQLSTAKDRGNNLAEGAALNNLALISLKAGKITEANTTLLNAVQVWEAMRGKLSVQTQNSTLQQEQSTTYRLLQQVLVAQNQPQAALEISEKGRFKSFLQLLGLRLYPESAVSGSVRLQKEITIPTLQQIKQIAREQNATLVEYSIIPDEGLYIWTIQPSGAIAFHRIARDPANPASNIEEVVASFRQSIPGSVQNSIQAQVLDKVDMRQSLQKLHQLLIKPIKDQLPKDPNARVIFIPQQELFLVPFAALADDEGKYLIEKHTIFTAPAIGVLKLSRRVRRDVRGNKVLVVGNPTMPSLPPAAGQPPQPLPPLLSAEQEALEIAQLLKTQAFTGNQAIKEVIVPQLAINKYIHLATYGIFNDISGESGAIALAPSGADNGLLTPVEILSLPAKPNETPLHAELVVVSASETSRGSMSGNGIIKLSGSLIAAGVPSTIVSLWSVPDAPTNELMTEFYRTFLQRRRDKAQALRQAMLAIMKQHPNPRDWAAFTLIGEAR